MAGPSFYHVCFAVPDIVAAMDELTGLVGVEWGEPARATLEEWDYTIVFSTVFPFIELISGPAGSPWDASAGPRFDHLGWWSDSLDRTACRWIAAGTEPNYDGRDAGRSFAYFFAPSIGQNIEVVDRSRQSDFVTNWADGPISMPEITEGPDN